ncbi:glycosyltransferase family 4 protein [Agromyces sp. GXS1127]|uniref:glycosyltransferase family 4 protein n=1 Tax=Agromyces sp. GXS1127 TaxID=3424181 RepID=UPI003D31F328
MRAVIATRLFPPEVGAAAFRLRALARGLDDAGASVRVITTTPPSGPADDGPIDVRRAPVLRDPGGNVRGYVQYLSFDVPLFFRLLVTPGDVVVAEPPPTTGAVVAVCSLLRRRPFVYYAADVWSDAVAATGASGVVARVLRAVEAWVLRRAARVVAVSPEVADRVADLGAARERITVAPNGVDTDVFQVGDERRPSSPTFVYTGTMSEWQGASIFIDALELVRRDHPDATLHFYGQGSDEANLRTRAARLPQDAVSFHGVVPPAVAAERLRTSTAALASIVPGLGYDFAKPTKIYAAAACGAPIVFAGAIDGAGSRLIDDAALGWAPGYDADAVAEAMRAAIAADGADERTVRRAARADWVERNASLARTGRIAAAAVLDTATGRRRAQSA